jgi:hypothetical protein
MRSIASSKVCNLMQTSESTSLLISDELRVSSRILVAKSLLVDVTLQVAGVAVSWALADRIDSYGRGSCFLFSLINIISCYLGH